MSRSSVARRRTVVIGRPVRLASCGRVSPVSAVRGALRIAKPSLRTDRPGCRLLPSRDGHSVRCSAGASGATSWLGSSPTIDRQKAVAPTFGPSQEFVAEPSLHNAAILMVEFTP